MGLIRTHIEKELSFETASARLAINRNAIEPTTIFCTKRRLKIAKRLGSLSKTTTNTMMCRPYSFALFLLAAVSSFADNETDVPGCACKLGDCGDNGDISSVGIQACLFTSLSNGVIEGIFDDPDLPICDTVAASTEFQEAVGDEAPFSFYQDSEGEYTIGPYYTNGQLSMNVMPGTCAEAIAAQLTCPTTSLNDLSQLQVTPTLCGASTIKFPDWEAFQVVERCRSYANRPIPPSEDSLHFYIGSVSSSKDELCNSNSVETPTLTSSDWIEDQSGRRYMCVDIPANFTEGNPPYRFMFMNMGNEPCKGPTTSTTSGASTTFGALLAGVAISSVAYFIGL